MCQLEECKYCNSLVLAILAEVGTREREHWLEDTRGEMATTKIKNNPMELNLSAVVQPSAVLERDPGHEFKALQYVVLKTCARDVSPRGAKIAVESTSSANVGATARKASTHPQSPPCTHLHSNRSPWSHLLKSCQKNWILVCCLLSDTTQASILCYT